MKKITFKNPIKEALYFQGKKWTISYLLAVAVLIPLSIVALWGRMIIVGTIGGLAALFFICYFVCWFGFETSTVLDDEEE